VSEGGLESLIFDSLINHAKYEAGESIKYDRENSVDLAMLLKFLQTTQPGIYAELELGENTQRRREFLTRLSRQIERRGVVNLLRKGLRHGPHSVDLYYAAPSTGNDEAAVLHRSNVFSVTRQLHFSSSLSSQSIDLVIFLNGLPIATLELKNRITKQTVQDAVSQYKRDRSIREPLFAPGRCVVHLAVDDQEVRMCAALAGEKSWFLPFNKGFNNGAGNPTNPTGLKTEYLWKEILTKSSLTDILENYVQDVETVEHNRRRRVHIFPRYHQLYAVRALLSAARASGPGHKYLIQHSAGSGKTNSISWLVHQLVELQQDGRKVFDSVLVVTDRTLLDRHIRDNIRQFSQVSAVLAHADSAAELRSHISAGKKIIVTTLQKFPYVLTVANESTLDRAFAVVIDEAHSSQGGRASNVLNETLAMGEQQPDDAVANAIATRGMPPNVSFFAFTATPKSRTLRLFGTPQLVEGQQTFIPFHVYSMKQAIDEGFIVDVLANFTPVSSYYRLVQASEADVEVDVARARKALRQYVESHSTAVAEKAQVIVEHFHGNVYLHRKIGGRAKAMVVANGVDRALAYYYAISANLREREASYGALVAFSGEREFRGQRVSEGLLNGFSANETAARFKQNDEYRLLIVADKYQTGFDEPLLHSMYIDKPLAGVQAVQTLSRLNRAHPQKRDTFVLDFADNAASVEHAFSDYYTVTLLAKDIDANKLHDLKEELDRAEVYLWSDVEMAVHVYLTAQSREVLDPLLDRAVHAYLENLDEVGQATFKGNAKVFVRTHSFFNCVLPYSNADWEILATYLSLLIGKLPTPRTSLNETSFLDAIDMDSFRVEVKASLAMDVSETDAQLAVTEHGLEAAAPERSRDLLSAIVASFNEQFGSIAWRDADKVRQAILVDIPARVASDVAYQNALNQSDPANARIEHNRALGRVITDLLVDQTELFKQFSDNESFRNWMQANVFAVTSEMRGTVQQAPPLQTSEWDSIVGPFYSQEEAEIFAAEGDRPPLLSLTTSDGFQVYPSFQLRGRDTIPELERLMVAWPAEIDDQWTFAAWLLCPQRGLNGQSVVDRLWASPRDTHLALFYIDSYLARVAS